MERIKLSADLIDSWTGEGSLSMMVHHRVMHFSKNWELALMQGKGMAGLSCEKRKEGRTEERGREIKESEEGVGRAEAVFSLLQVPKRLLPWLFSAFARSWRVLGIRTWWSQFLDPGFSFAPPQNQIPNRNFLVDGKTWNKSRGRQQLPDTSSQLRVMCFVVHIVGKLTFYSCSCKLKLSQVINVTFSFSRVRELWKLHRTRTAYGSNQ